MPLGRTPSILSSKPARVRAWFLPLNSTRNCSLKSAGSVLSWRNSKMRASIGGFVHLRGDGDKPHAAHGENVFDRRILSGQGEDGTANANVLNSLAGTVCPISA